MKTTNTEQTTTTPETTPTATATTPTTPGKWTTGQPTPGPRQVKRINELISKIRWTGSTIREISGIIGQESHTRCFNIIIGGVGMTQYSRDAYHAVAAKYAWTLTRDNTTLIEADLEAVLKDISNPERYHQQDTRITPEEHARREAANTAAREERDRRAAEKNAAIKAAGGLTDSEKSSVGIKEIAEITRKTLAERQPRNRYSVTIERYAGGQSMSIALLSAPFEAIDRERVIESYKKQEIEYHHAPNTITPAEIETKYADEINRRLQYHQLGNVRGEYKDGISNGPSQPLTREAWEALREAQEIADRYNWDRSDSMTDYFDVHFYLHLNIGTSGRPFTRIDTPAPTNPTGGDTPTEPITGATVRRNEEKNGVEVLFPGKPSPDTIAALKNAGFRWSFKTRVWYARYSPEQEAAARRIAGAA